jgi:tetratricopeptide (TPR) repeat protein
LGQYGKSLTQFKTALASLIKTYGHSHQSVSSLYINIANILIMQGKYAEAQGYLEKAQAVNQSVGPRSKRVQMFTLITLGEVSMHRDMLENAMEYMLQAEAICLELFGNEHHNMAYIWGMLGDLHMENNNLVDARMFYNKSFEIYLKVYGPDHQTSKEGKNKLNKLDHQNL